MIAPLFLLPSLLFSSFSILNVGLFCFVFQTISLSIPLLSLLSFCLSLFQLLSACLQDASAQTQQMLKGKTGATLDAISILLKDH